MKIVIDIPDKKYESLKMMESDTIDWRLGVVEKAIINGTPLPKGHGRLIDADALPLNSIDDANYGSNYIRIAPTIIEADKGDE